MLDCKQTEQSHDLNIIITNHLTTQLAHLRGSQKYQCDKS